MLTIRNKDLLITALMWKESIAICNTLYIHNLQKKDRNIKIKTRGSQGNFVIPLNLNTGVVYVINLIFFLFHCFCVIRFQAKNIKV